jgi:hypothetical protein
MMITAGLQRKCALAFLIVLAVRLDTTLPGARAQEKPLNHPKQSTATATPFPARRRNRCIRATG